MTGLFIFIVILVSVACAFLTGYVASEKGRPFGLWFLLGLLMPIIALLALIALPGRAREQDAYPVARGEGAEDWRDRAARENKRRGRRII